jgi:hypothetical protein
MGSSRLISVRADRREGDAMSTLTLILVIAGGVLILAGIAMLLIVRFQGADSTIKGPGDISLNGPAGLVVVVIGVVCLIVPLFIGPSKRSSTELPRSSSPTGPFTPPPAENASATLTSPAENLPVSRSNGFTAGGMITSPGSSSVWILDFDGGYTVDQRASVSSGQWSAVDKPLGDPTDSLPFDLVMVAVLADPDCAGQLTKISDTSDDHTDQLPDGCHEFGRRTVHISRP